MKQRCKMSLSQVKIYNKFFPPGTLIVRAGESEIRSSMGCQERPGIAANEVYEVVNFSPAGILAVNYKSGLKVFMPLDSDYTGITKGIIRKD